MSPVSRSSMLCYEAMSVFVIFVVTFGGYADLVLSSDEFHRESIPMQASATSASPPSDEQQQQTPRTEYSSRDEHDALSSTVSSAQPPDMITSFDSKATSSDQMHTSSNESDNGSQAVNDEETGSAVTMPSVTVMTVSSDLTVSADGVHQSKYDASDRQPNSQRYNSRTSRKPTRSSAAEIFRQLQIERIKLEILRKLGLREPPKVAGRRETPFEAEADVSVTGIGSRYDESLPRPLRGLDAVAFGRFSDSSYNDRLMFDDDIDEDRTSSEADAAAPESRSARGAGKVRHHRSRLQYGSDDYQHEWPSLMSDDPGSYRDNFDVDDGEYHGTADASADEDVTDEEDEQLPPPKTKKVAVFGDERKSFCLYLGC